MHTKFHLWIQTFPAVEAVFGLFAFSTLIILIGPEFAPNPRWLDILEGIWPVTLLGCVAELMLGNCMSLTCSCWHDLLLLADSFSLVDWFFVVPFVVKMNYFGSYSIYVMVRFFQMTTNWYSKKCKFTWYRQGC